MRSTSRFVQRWVAAIAVGALTLFTFVAMPPQISQAAALDSAGATGQISGQLSTLLGEADFSGVSVTAWHGESQHTSQNFYASLDSSGAYTIRGLPAGSYRVEVSTSGTDFVSQWLGGASFEDATVITLEPGEIHSGADVELAVGGQISGQLSTLLGGADFSDVWVYAWDGESQHSGQNFYASLDSSGAYTIRGLPAGTYRVQVSTSGTDFVSQWFGGASFEDATVITLEPGEVRQAADIELVVGGQISGQLSAALGSASFSGLSVVAWGGLSQYSSPGFYGSVDSSGAYTIRGVPAGSYRLQVSTSGTNFAPRWFGGASFEDATVIALEPAETRSGVDVELVIGGQISGQLSSSIVGADFSRVSVSAWDGETQHAGRSFGGTVEASGAYTIRGLPEGTYRLQVSTWDTDFLPQWFGGASFDDASRLRVTGGNATVANLSLEVGAKVSGTAIDAVTGEGIPNLPVTLYSSTGSSWTQDTYQTMTNAAGEFAIRGIVPGSYRVLYASQTEAGYQRSWLGGATFETAETVTLDYGGSRTGVNASLRKISSVAFASAPVVSADRPVDAQFTLSWTKPLSEEPIIGYQVLFNYGYGGDGMTVIGGDTLTTDVSFGFMRETTSVLVSVAAITATSTGVFDSTVVNFSGDKPLLARPGAELVEASSTSLTFRATAGEGSAGAELGAWTAILEGDPNHPFGVTKHVSGVTENEAVFTFTGLTPGRSYDLYVHGRETVGEITTSGATEWGSLLSQVTLPEVEVPLVFTAAPDPVVTGSAVVGQTLTAAAGVWAPVPDAVTYQWRRDGVAISGATASTYVLKVGDQGRNVSVAVTASKAGYESVTRTSVALSVAPAPVEPEVPAPAVKTTPVYRFWSDTQQSHFYTASAAERDHILKTYPKNVWQYETVAYQAFTTQLPGTIPLHRFWSDIHQGHFFTASTSEKDQVIANYSRSVWAYEGIAYYVYPSNSKVSASKEVYRFWSEAKSRHFYTASPAEKARVITTYDRRTWAYETIGYRVPS